MPGTCFRLKEMLCKGGLPVCGGPMAGMELQGAQEPGEDTRVVSGSNSGKPGGNQQSPRPAACPQGA